jgi:glycosyltransferase involved in cell wall biosynthesis
MDSFPQVTVLRYWGSHFKHARHPGTFQQEFKPFIARGWRCVFVLERLPEESAWLKPLTDLGVEIECAPRPTGNFDFRCIRRVKDLCQRVRATVFHCDNLHTSPLIGAWLARVPVRVWCKRSMNADYEECRPRTIKERAAISIRLSCGAATRVVAVSSAVKSELVSLGIADSKVIVRNNPRRLGAVPPQAESEGLRRGWGFGPSDVVFLSLGHAVPVKGWDVLVRAFAEVAKVAPRAKLVLVGSYEAPHEKTFHAQLRRQIDAGRLSEQVRFTGHLSRITPALQAADVFVLPSRSEGCANALVEALETGLPCVSTRVGHAAEVIQDGVNGLLVERNDPAVLAQALQRMVVDDPFRSEAARRATLPALIPTLEGYAEQIAQDYADLLEEKGVPAGTAMKEKASG